MLLANKEGIVVPSPIVNLAAALAANAQVVFTIPVLAGQLVGTKSAKILKVHLFNNAAGNQAVSVGTGVGAAFVALIPALFSGNNVEDIYDNVISAEAFANITAFPQALVAAGTIDIQLEVAVIG